MDNPMEFFRVALIELKARRRARIPEIALAAGVTPRHIQGVLSSKEKKSLGLAAQMKVAEFFGLNVSEMFSIGREIVTGQVIMPSPKVSGMIEVEQSNVSQHYDPRQITRVPIISWVQAGDWQYAADPMQPGVADEWIETSATHSRHAYALVVHGDSMEPEFRDGDVITVDPERRAENGSYVIVKNGAEATFKQFVVDGQSVFLKPLNGRYPIKDMTGIEFRVVGVVVEKRKRY